VNLKGLSVRDAQECESKGVKAWRSFDRKGFVEKKGVARLIDSFMAEYIMELPLCQ